MRAAFQIPIGLAAAAAAAFVPLSSARDDLNLTRTRTAKLAALPDAQLPAIDPATGKPIAPGKSAPSRIPPGASPAEASATITLLGSLDGKLLSTRDIIDALERVMNLPASHMDDALAVLKDIKAPALSGFLFSALFSRWGELDPDEARAKLADVGSNPFARYAGTASLASGWLEKDPDTFISFLTDKSGKPDPKLDEMRKLMAGSLFSGMNVLDPATADRLIAASPPDKRAELILQVAQNNPDIDLSAAGERALAEARNADDRAGVHSRIARIMAERGDPANAISYASSLSESKERKASYDSSLNLWMKEDKDAATAWIKSQPIDIQAEAAGGLRGSVNGMSSSELSSFANNVDPSVQPQLWSMAVRGAADRDPADAVNFLPNVKPEDRPQSYQTVAESWTKKDPEAASGWVDQLPQGNEKDKAIVGLTSSVGSKEPDSAAMWASTISDPEIRAVTTEKYATDWLKRDPAAAAQWIQQAPALAPEQKLRLLQPSGN
jgi:hypothetical protein